MTIQAIQLDNNPLGQYLLIVITSSSGVTFYQNGNSLSSMEYANGQLGYCYLVWLEDTSTVTADNGSMNY